MPGSTPYDQEQRRARERLEAKLRNAADRQKEAGAEAGRILSAWRRAQRVSQLSLAELAFVSDGVVGRIERCNYGAAPPSLIEAVRDLGGPARELEDLARIQEEQRAELARLRLVLSRTVIPPDVVRKLLHLDPVSPAGPVIVGQRPLAAPAFQRREDLLAALAASGPDVPVVRVMTGMRGVGKSQLAAAYARFCVDAGWRLVAWVSAGDSAQVLSGLAKVATALGIDVPDADEQAQAVRHRLEADGEQCLLVFDDVTELDELAEVLPSAGKCQVVITSNHVQAAAFGVHVPVEVFTDTEALSFLAERTGHDNQAGAAELASLTGFLPLALAQAAAVIASQRLSYPTFLARLRALPVQEYLVHVTGDPYRRGVGEVIVMALDAAADADPTGLARGLISFLALMAAEGTPRSYLHGAGRQGLLGQSHDVTAQPAVVDAALGKLADASLITFSADGSAVAGHPLTLRVALERAAASGGSTMISVAAGAVKLLGETTGSLLDPRQDMLAAKEAAKQILGLHEHLALLLTEHDVQLATDLLRLRCWTLDCLVRLHDGFSPAVKHGPLIVADCERMLGPDNARTLHARTDLATAFYQAGQLDDAIAICELNLAVCRIVLGEGHRETLSVRHILALSLEDAGGSAAEIIPMWEQLLAAHTRELGSDDEDTISTRNDLVHAYEENLDLDKAVPMREELVEFCSSKFGAKHENTVVCQNNLAHAYELAGRLDEATLMFERSAANFAGLFGSRHPYSLQGQHNLAGIYRISGRLPEAISLYEQVAGERAQVLGDSHPDTLRSRNNLGLALSAAGRSVEAIRLLERTVADRARVLGDSHPDTMKSRSHLALAYEAAGQSPSDECGLP